MRIRLLRDYSNNGKKVYRAGQVIDLDPFQACALIRAGVAMQDKSLDGPSEIKLESPPIKRRRKTRR